MLNKLKNFISKSIKIKISFSFPVKKKLLLYDETHSLILKEIVKADFNILKVRNKEIYFWILLKQIIFFDFSFKTYCINYIKFVSPKVIITFIDNNVQFYDLKSNFKKIKFISIQNGIRGSFWFKDKIFLRFKQLECDHLFVLNDHIKNEYKKIIKAKYHVLGCFKNNIVNIQETKKQNQFLLISEFAKEKEILNPQRELFKKLNLYFSRSNKKLHILLRKKDSISQKREIKFYNSIFKSNYVGLKASNWKNSYEIVDQFENIIFMYSTLGYEAISRKKKVGIFSPHQTNSFSDYIGWPSPYKKIYNFFCSKSFSYNEIRRVLNNINQCSQVKWKKKYYSAIKGQLYLNKNNTILKKILIKLL